MSISSECNVYPRRFASHNISKEDAHEAKMVYREAAGGVLKNRTTLTRNNIVPQVTIWSEVNLQGLEVTTELALLFMIRSGQFAPDGKFGLTRESGGFISPSKSSACAFQCTTPISIAHRSATCDTLTSQFMKCLHSLESGVG